MTHFDPKDLKPISVLHAEGQIPMAYRTLVVLCRKGKFPATKCGNQWMTTETHIKSWLWKRSNDAFKKIAA